MQLMQQMQQMQQAQNITPQQQQVIPLRFGLEDGKNMTLAKIGAALEISRERVRQIEREALTKLRKRQGDMREYLAGWRI